MDKTETARTALSEKLVSEYLFLREKEKRQEVCGGEAAKTETEMETMHSLLCRDAHCPAGTEQIDRCEEKICGGGFSRGIYSRAAAVYIAEAAEEQRRDGLVKKMKLLDRHIQREFPGETGKMSVLWAAFLAVSEITVPELQQRFSEVQRLLKNWVGGEHELMMMVYILFLFHTDDIAMCERAVQLFRKAGEKNYGGRRAEQLSLLAMTAVCRRKAELVMEELQAVSRRLREEGAAANKEAADAAAAALFLCSCFYAEDNGKKDVVIRSMRGNFLLITELLCGLAVIRAES